ncbi:MAG: ParB N-terminal domain-containing protein [Nitrospirae bacterium]|nr:ParB N-terminal domain-containing protein [Nitrospirota bacterium]
MKVENRPIAEVRPYPGNPRKNKAAVDKVAASIREFGWRQPIVVDSEMTIVVGHTRYEAAKVLGLDEVPVHVAEGLTPNQVRAYRLADNRLHEGAEWDEGLLRIELSGLDAEHFDLGLTGFADEELSRLLGEAVDGQESQVGDDGVPEPPEVPVSRPGDLWILGDHRLLCGDSTKPEDVDRLMAGEKPALFSTDPPYIIDYTGADRPREGKDWSDVYREIDIKDAEGFLRGVFENGLRVCRENAAWYCWHAHKRAALIERIWTDLGVLNHQQIVWVKPIATMTYSCYPWKHEPCLMGWRQGHKPPHKGDNTHQVTSVWSLDWEGAPRPIGNEHPTQKPLEIFAIPMRQHTDPGEVCYEPFSGSGSQLIAGERLHRKVRAMEIQPTFVDVAIRRWQEATGKVAVLEDDGKTFAQVAEARGVECGGPNS